MVDNYYIQDTEDKTEELLKVIIQAVKKTHTILIRCQKLTEEIDVVKNKKDKELMLTVLQRYINMYWNILERNKMIRIYAMNKQMYEVIQIEDLNRQLNIIKCVIYWEEAKKSASSEAIRQCLIKILKSNENFSKREIDILFS